MRDSVAGVDEAVVAVESVAEAAMTAATTLAVSAAADAAMEEDEEVDDEDDMWLEASGAGRRGGMEGMRGTWRNSEKDDTGWPPPGGLLRT